MTTLLELRTLDVVATLLELEVVAILLELGAMLLELRELEVTVTLLEVVGWLELLGRELLDGTELAGIELVAPTIPNGAGCAAQVEREIQLLLFS